MRVEFNLIDVILLVIIVLETVIFFIERQDMLNRLMAKSYPEYKAVTGKKPSSSTNFIKKHIESGGAKTIN